MSDSISCQVIEVAGDDETCVAILQLAHVPRIGELLWCYHDPARVSSWRVIDVAYHVRENSPRQSSVLYVRPEDE